MYTSKTVAAALPITAKLLAGKLGVEVRFGGQTAMTNGKIIYIPHLPLDSRRAQILALGYLVHENGHVRDTDFGVGSKNPLKSFMENVLEDIRIEKRAWIRYPGAKKTLNDLINELVKEGKQCVVPDASSPIDVLLAYMRQRLRSSVLQQTALEPAALQSEAVLRSIVPGHIVDTLTAMMFTVQSCDSTADVVRLTDDICAYLKLKVDEPPEPEEQQPQQQPQQQQSDDSSQDQDQQQSGASGNDSQENDDKEESKDESDTSDQAKNGPSDDENQSKDDKSGTSDEEKENDSSQDGSESDSDQDDAAKDQQGTGEDESKDETDGEQQSSDTGSNEDESDANTQGKGGEDGDSEDDTDGQPQGSESGTDKDDSNDQSQANGTGDDSKDGKDVGSKDAGADPDTDDSNADSTKDDQGSNGQDDAKSDASTGDQDDAQTDTGTSGSGDQDGNSQNQETDASGSGSAGSDSDAGKPEPDEPSQDGTAAGQQQDALTDEDRSTLQSILTAQSTNEKTDLGDVIAEELDANAGMLNDDGTDDRCDLPLGVSAPDNKEHLAEMMQETRAATNALRLRIEQMLETERRVKRYNSTSGRRIVGSRAWRIEQGNPRVFERRIEGQEIDTAVYILLDRSSSMYESIGLASQATLALAYSISGIDKVKVAAGAFPAYNPQKGTANDVMVLTGYNERVSATAGRYARVGVCGDTPMADALLFAQYQLLSQNVTRRILFVAADGEPNYGTEELTKKILRMGERAGIETVGLGIMKDISHLIEESKKIDSIDQMPKAVFEIMQSKLSFPLAA